MLTPEIEPELFAYTGGVAANNNSNLVAANGTANHIHLLILLSKTIGVSELKGVVKNKYRANTGKYAAWISASHIEKPPKRTEEQ